MPHPSFPSFFPPFYSYNHLKLLPPNTASSSRACAATRQSLPVPLHRSRRLHRLHNNTIHPGALTTSFAHHPALLRKHTLIPCRPLSLLMPATACPPSRPRLTPWTTAAPSSSAPSALKQIRTSADCKPHSSTLSSWTHFLPPSCVELRAKVFNGRLCDLLVFVAPKLPPLAAVAITIPVRSYFHTILSRFLSHAPSKTCSTACALGPRSQGTRHTSLSTHECTQYHRGLWDQVHCCCCCCCRSSSRAAVLFTRGWGACCLICHSPPLPMQTTRISFPA